MLFEILIGIVIFFFGASIFSFLNVVIFRVPRKISFVKGNSMCPVCGHRLSGRDMVPVLSWLFLRGKCRYCGAPVSKRYAAVELLGGALALLCAELWRNDPARALTVFAFAGVLTVVAFVDLDTMEIPDGFVISAAVIGLLSIASMPGVTLLERLVGVFSVSVPLLLLTLAIPGAFGGGDIKLTAACGILLGWKLSLLALFFGIVIGGAQGIFLLAAKRAGRKDHFAFGPHLCIGMLLSLFVGNALLNWYLGLL